MGVPPLRLIHARRSLRPSSVERWSGKTTEEIVQSLAPGSAAPLLVAGDGTVLDGNTRVTLLVERGYDVNGLPRTPYER
jgi:hypothetical protein